MFTIHFIMNLYWWLDSCCPSGSLDTHIDIFCVCHTSFVHSTGLVTSPCLQNLAFQILAMAKIQTVGNNEERFVLAILKEFVKTWGDGGEGSFQLDCKDGQCKKSMEHNLGAPGDKIRTKLRTEGRSTT